MQDSKDVKSKDGIAVEFEDAIALTGYGKYNIALLITCGGCLMAVILETLSMSYILPAAQCDLDLSTSEKGMISSVSFLGVVLSSHLWGFIGDTLGRRKLILITTYISFIMSILSSLSPFVWLFILLRFLNGFFIGGPSAVIYAYLGEFHDNAHRARILSWAATFIALATIGLPGIAWLILPMTWSFDVPILGIKMRPWRLLIIIYAIPSIICATSLLQFGESPKFLWVHDKPKQALAILRSVFVSNTGKDESKYPVRSLAIPDERPPTLDDDDDLHKKCGPIENVLKFFKLMWKQTVPLFRFPLVMNTLMTSALQFGCFASSSGFLMWLPDLLNKLNNFMAQQPNSTVMVCESLEANKYYHYEAAIEDEIDCSDVVDVEVFKVLLILGSVFGLTYLFLGAVISAIGKKMLLCLLLCFTGIGGIVVKFVSGYTTILATIGLFLSAGTCVSVINAIVVDLFPTQYRAMAMALSLMTGRFGAVAGSAIVGYLLEFNCSSAFFIFGGEHLVLLIVALLLPIPLFQSKKQ